MPGSAVSGLRDRGRRDVRGRGGEDQAARVGRGPVEVTGGREIAAEERVGFDRRRGLVPDHFLLVLEGPRRPVIRRGYGLRRRGLRPSARGLVRLSADRNNVLGMSWLGVGGRR